MKNRLEIAVPKGNPSKITWLADFGALCAQQVPCGAAAKKVFEAAKITGKPDSLEQDVKAALTKVSLGEVDAALVYKTDVQAAAGKVDGSELPEAHKAINEYPIATLTKAPNASGAKAFRGNHVARADALRWLETVSLAPFAKSRPRSLDGGGVLTTASPAVGPAHVAFPPAAR